MAVITVVDSQRKKKRELLDSLGDDLIRYIAELITNSDDSYRRLESAGLVPLDEVKVIYIELCKDKRNNGTDKIIVTDNAEGLTKEKLEQIFGTYGADNAGGVESRTRGIFGQGASDVMRSAAYEQKTAEILSIKNGKFSKLRYSMNNHFDSSIDVKDIPQSAHQLVETRKNLRIPENGTAISFGIPSTVKYNKNTKKKLKDLIEKCTSFRYLLAQPNRKIILIIDGQETVLSSEIYLFDKMEFLKEKFFTYNFQGKDLQCQLKIYKNENKIEDETQLLVVDENKAVFDNTLFNFETMSSVKNISGELIIEGLYQVCYDNLNDDINPNAIVKDNRTGFDTKNPFYVGLNKTISPILENILKEHGTKTKNTDLTNNKKFSEALKKLNKYIKQEIKDTISGGNLGGQEPPISGIKFVRSHASLTNGKTYDLKLLINSSIVFQDDIIKIKMESNDNIEISPKAISYDETDIRENGLVVKDVTIKALKETIEPITIIAECNNYKSFVLIDVIPLDIHDPINGLEFYPNHLILSYNETHKASLFFDKNIIPIGSEIILSSQEDIELINSSYVITEKDMIDENIGCIIVKSKGGTLSNDYLIKAKYNDVETSVKITLIEKSKNNNSGGGLIAGIKLEPREDMNFQAYFQPHTHEIVINSKNPINLHILGSLDDKDPNNPKFSKDQTKYLCEIIVTQAAQLLVKEKNVKKGEINIDSIEDTIDDIQNLIQQHKNKMFMDIYPAMVNLTE